MKKATGIVLPAAGASTRMNGEAKQLLGFQGETFLRRAAKTALACEQQSVAVVLGANAERLKQEVIDLPALIVVNESWTSGMGASLKKGLFALLETDKDFDAVIVMLVDQPFITPEVTNRLSETFEKTRKPIVASSYRDTIGVPALFARGLFDELLSLEGDAGARFLIKKHTASVEQIAVPEAAFDVDTIEDYCRLLGKAN